MAADNEAKIIITADPAQFQKFLVDTVRGLRQVEQEGKKSVKELDGAFATFQRNSAEAAKAILREVTGPVTDPLKQAYNQALGNARAWRQESTRIMGETGSDWKIIGGEIDAVSLRTRRMPEDTARYLDTVRQLTGSWKYAKDSAEDYSDLARVLGKQTLSEMAPLAGTMQNVFRVENVKGFFEQAIAGAKALGQSGELTARQWERIAPMMTGIVPRAPAQGAAFAKSAAAMLPAMQKLGLSPEESEMAMQQIVGSYSGDNLINLERQMKGAGVLARGEHLKDKYGRLTRSLPEMMRLESELIRRHARSLGGGAELQEKIAKQSVSPLMAGLLVDNDRFQKYISEAATAQPAGEMEARKRALEQTPEMQRQLNERLLAQTARKDIGENKLALQDLGVSMGGAAAPKSTDQDWRAKALEKGRTLSTYGALVPGAQAYGAAAAVGFGLAEGSLQAEREAAAKGTTSLGLAKMGEPSEYRQAGTHGMTIGELLGKLFSRDTQREQAAATADALGSKVLKVQLVAPAQPMPLSGGGEQG